MNWQEHGIFMKYLLSPTSPNAFTDKSGFFTAPDMLLTFVNDILCGAKSVSDSVEATSNGEVTPNVVVVVEDN